MPHEPKQPPPDNQEPPPERKPLNVEIRGWDEVNQKLIISFRDLQTGQFGNISLANTELKEGLTKEIGKYSKEFDEKTRKGPSVIVLPNREIAYEHVVEVLDAVKVAGFQKVGLQAMTRRSASTHQ